MAQDTPLLEDTNNDAQTAEFRAYLSRLDEEFRGLFAEMENQLHMMAQKQAQLRQEMDNAEEQIAGMKDALRGVASLYKERNKQQQQQGLQDSSGISCIADPREQVYWARFLRFARRVSRPRPPPAYSGDAEPVPPYSPN
ncbi:hypothetical protein HDU85_007053 [Gaertneriomyces sp. JEL0708]|nr:hypothetical protein HDU85_007053 [Gaertneriomyces sp. JEL0708]